MWIWILIKGEHNTGLKDMHFVYHWQRAANAMAEEVKGRYPTLEDSRGTPQLGSIPTEPPRAQQGTLESCLTIPSWLLQLLESV